MATLNDFVNFVESQAGDVYRLGYEVSRDKWDDADPSDIWDCSELVEVSYGRYGIKIRDLAAWQYEDTNPVSSPAVGDLVFLKNNPMRPHGIGHVGIITRVYANDARIVEAKGRDYGVVISSLRVWKSKSTFAGIRRHPGFAAAFKDDGPMQYRVGFGWGESEAAVAGLEAKCAELRVKVVADGPAFYYHAAYPKNKTIEAYIASQDALHRFHPLVIAKTEFARMDVADGIGDTPWTFEKGGSA